MNVFTAIFGPEQRRTIGAEAKQLLENKHFNEAWDSLAAELEAVALNCSPDDKDRAVRTIISKQLLAALKREFVRKVEDGEMAKAEIELLAPKQRFFKR